MVVLATLRKQWLAQGRPDELFTVASMDPGDTRSFLLAPQVGMNLTNIGDCIPSKTGVSTSASTMDQLDLFFAAATALPTSLSDTDLNTLDRTALAKVGVFACARKNPQWS